MFEKLYTHQKAFLTFLCLSHKMIFSCLQLGGESLTSCKTNLVDVNKYIAIPIESRS